MPNYKVLLFIGAFFVGFMFSMAMETYGAADKKAIPAEAGLSSLLKLELENEQLANDNAALREELAKFQEGQNALSLAAQKLNQARINAGLTDMKGRGVVITLDDSKQEVELGEDINNYVIHEQYLRQIVNALWNGGAEAISINNQRLTTHTEIFCAGSYIQINGTRQMPPYRIKAIGNPANLQSALDFYFWNQLGYYQEKYGITRELEVPEEPIVIPAAKNLPEYRFAEPVKEGQ